MTREEAIQFLDNMKHEEAGRAIGKDGFYAELMGYHVEALNMAIKALEVADLDGYSSRLWKAAYERGKADAEQRWIPVSERLPEKPYGCLVTIEDEEPMTGQWFENILPYFVGWDGERWNDADGEQCPFEVIAWMPLPEPYKPNEDNVSELCRSNYAAQLESLGYNPDGNPKNGGKQ